MQCGQLVVDEPIRLSSVLTPSKSDGSPSLTKVMATLGPKSHSVEIIEACLKAGMSVARFDFSCLDVDYHQETIDNLRIAVKNAKKLCAVMLDTVGPELQIRNKSGNPIELNIDDLVTITPDMTKEPSAKILPIKYDGLAKKVKKGDTVFLGQYLFTGNETTSVWLEVTETNGTDIICQVKNSAKLTGLMFNLHVSRVQVDLPTLTDTDKQIISTWGTRNKVDYVSLHYTRHADDVREVRAFLASQNLEETQVFAKVETLAGMKHFDEILKEADGVVLSRGTLGIDLPPEKVFLFQKSAAHRCNMAGKPVIITRVVDSMAGNLRPTRAEATDVANAVLDGADGILLGGETFGGMYPVEAIKIVRKICAEAEYVYNQALNFKRIVKHVGEPMSEAESVASSAVCIAAKVNAAMIAVFTSSGGAARYSSLFSQNLLRFLLSSVDDGKTVISQLIESVCKCGRSGDEAVELGAMKAILAAVRSPRISFHGEFLDFIVKSCYNVYLGSKIGNSRVCAKAILAQIVSILFARAEEDCMTVSRFKVMSVSELLEFSDQNLSEGSSVKLVQGLINEVMLSNQGFSEESYWNFENFKGKSEDGGGGGESRTLMEEESIEEDDEGGVGEESSRIREDGFELFKNLCKLSMKFTSQEYSDDKILLKGKILSLELLKVIMDNCGLIWRSNERFINVVKQFLCLSLLKNSAVSVMTIFQLLCSIFMSLLLKFRSRLKDELGIFYSMLILRVLENVIQPTFVQKLTVLNILEKISQDPQLVVDIYVNYDCDVDAPNLYERTVNGLLKTAHGPPSGSTTTLTPAQDLTFRDLGCA